ncbi:MAG: winged helix-turn-helix domain-containing protein, partial [Thermoanaerobaculia bacterium]|nr:winged helix-turn-helix domain-containing protein [Thermoanaerobaculia bacterium]
MDATGQRAGNNRRFKVGEWLVHPQLRELVSPDGKETVEARSVDILVALAEAAGEVLSRSELLELGWGDRFVGEEVLSHAIWDLRRALGDEPKTPRFIQTVHGKGYRLVAKVSWLEDGVGEQARYVLVEEIGRGAMGVVWRAQDPRLERDVAIKYLAPELRRDRDSEVRFLREARADARLDHPNICAVYEVDETDDGRMYLVMPLYTGQTLRERIDEGPLPWRDAVLIASQIAAGLGAAHEAGIVHRD